MFLRMIINKFFISKIIFSSSSRNMVIVVGLLNIIIYYFSLFVLICSIPILSISFLNLLIVGDSIASDDRQFQQEATLFGRWSCLCMLFGVGSLCIFFVCPLVVFLRQLGGWNQFTSSKPGEILKKLLIKSPLSLLFSRESSFRVLSLDSNLIT